MFASQIDDLVTFKPSTERLLLEKGHVDIALSLLPDQLSLAQNKDIEIVLFPYSGAWYMPLDVADERLKNPKVRLALKHLVDYDGMVNTFLNRRFPVQQTVLPIGIFGAIAYNPCKLPVSDQAENLNLLTHLRCEHGLTMLMISHDLAVIAPICDRIDVMRSSRILEMTTAAPLVEDRVTDPYSQQLLHANQGFDASGVIIDAAA